MSHPSHTDEVKHGSIVALTIGAMGVVYGDIGTSPLYAINEIFFGHAALPQTEINVVGAISLVIWTITLVVLFKYLLFVLRADNDGEGGTFALYGLAHRHKRRGLGFLLWILMLASSARVSSRRRSACSPRSKGCASSRRASITSSCRSRWPS